MSGYLHLLLRQPSRVEVIHSTPVGFAALVRTRCAFVGQFVINNLTARKAVVSSTYARLKPVSTTNICHSSAIKALG